MTKDLGVTEGLLHSLMTGVRKGTSVSTICAQYNEEATRVYLERERSYLHSLLTRKGTMLEGSVAEVSSGCVTIPPLFAVRLHMASFWRAAC